MIIKFPATTKWLEYVMMLVNLYQVIAIGRSPVRQSTDSVVYELHSLRCGENDWNVSTWCARLCSLVRSAGTMYARALGRGASTWCQRHVPVCLMRSAVTLPASNTQLDTEWIHAVSQRRQRLQHRGGMISLGMKLYHIVRYQRTMFMRSRREQRHLRNLIAARSVDVERYVTRFRDVDKQLTRSLRCLSANTIYAYIQVCSWYLLKRMGFNTDTHIRE